MSCNRVRWRRGRNALCPRRSAHTKAQGSRYSSGYRAHGELDPHCKAGADDPEHASKPQKHEDKLGGSPSLVNEVALTLVSPDTPAHA